MQTADIAKSRKCWCERIWAADLARSRSAHMLWSTLRYWALRPTVFEL